MPRNPLYNLTSRQSQQAISEISKLGQRLGLHYELPAELHHRDDLTLEEIATTVIGDFEVLYQTTALPISPVFSWHSPSTLPLEHRGLVGLEIDGLMNSNALVEQGLPYFSDSNHRYSVIEWKQIVSTLPDYAHILIHPFQWVLGLDTMEETFAVVIRDFLAQCQVHLLENRVFRKSYPQGWSTADFGCLTSKLIRTAREDPHVEEKYL
jgi:hypothetical protein